MTPPTPPPLPQPTRYTCPNCGAGWNEPRPYCPHCGAAQVGQGVSGASGPSWLKVVLIVFGVLGVLVFCAFGACIFLLTNPKF